MHFIFYIGAFAGGLITKKHLGFFPVEHIYVPFGYMLILSDDVVHGGCLGNYGSFRFHFPLKQLNKRAQEKLHHDDEATIK